MYLMRLDDASEHMNLNNWLRMERILDKYGVRPIFGIIPANQDPDLLKFNEVTNFWQLMIEWQDKGWTPALHGYGHVFETNEGGIKPVNKRSEFAVVVLERQREKIRDGYRIIKDKGISASIFFAPAHTFDENTLIALKEETPIRIISDTVANDIYYKNSIYYIPQQSGRGRKLPFKVTTFCYHPNTMSDDDYLELEEFLKINGEQFTSFKEMVLVKRHRGIVDLMLNKIYFMRRK